jgi:hypothetical protein
MRRQTKHVRPMYRHFGRLLSQMALPATVKRPCYDPIVCATRILISFSALPGGSGFKPVFRTHDYHILLALANVTRPVSACFSASMQASHSGTYILSTLRNDMPDLGVARGFCLAITPAFDREGRLAQGSSPKAIRVWFPVTVSEGSTEGLTLLRHCDPAWIRSCTVVADGSDCGDDLALPIIRQSSRRPRSPLRFRWPVATCWV